MTISTAELFFLFKPASIWKFQGHGLHLSHSCNLCYSCGNTTSFNPLCQARDWTGTSIPIQAAAVRFVTQCTTVGTPERTPFKIWLNLCLFPFWIILPWRFQSYSIDFRVLLKVRDIQPTCFMTIMMVFLSQKPLFVFFYLGLHLWYMEVPRLGELQLLAYTTATATWDPSFICNQHHSMATPAPLTHWVRPGTEPTSSWMLVGFITPEPQPFSMWCHCWFLVSFSHWTVSTLGIMLQKLLEWMDECYGLRVCVPPEIRYWSLGLQWDAIRR